MKPHPANLYRIPLLQIRKIDGSIDFSNMHAVRGEYFIGNIEFNNSGVRQHDHGENRNELSLYFGDKVAHIYAYGALVDMQSDVFSSITPMIAFDTDLPRKQPLQTPFIHVRIDDTDPYPVILTSGGKSSVASYQTLSSDRHAVLPVALFIEKNGKLYNSDEISRGMLEQINAGLLPQGAPPHPSNVVKGPFFNQAVVYQEVMSIDAPEFAYENRRVASY